jgi:micrococcal nuclease
MKQLMRAKQLAALLLMATLYSCAHPSPVLAAEYGDKAATISRVYDGDSLTASIPDWPGIIGSAIPVRVNGIDTPELYGKCAEEKAKALLAKAFTVNFVNAKPVTLKAIKRDKYFRILANVYVGEESLADGLIKADLARPYFGGTKTSWCVNP